MSTFDLCCTSTVTTSSGLLAAITHRPQTLQWSSPCLQWQLLYRTHEQFLITGILTAFLCCIYCFISPGLNVKMAVQPSAFAVLFMHWVVAVFIFPTLQECCFPAFCHHSSPFLVYFSFIFSDKLTHSPCLDDYLTPFPGFCLFYTYIKYIFIRNQ